MFRWCVKIVECPLKTKVPTSLAQYCASQALMIVLPPCLLFHYRLLLAKSWRQQRLEIFSTRCTLLSAPFNLYRRQDSAHEVHPRRPTYRRRTIVNICKTTNNRVCVHQQRTGAIRLSKPPRVYRFYHVLLRDYYRPTHARARENRDLNISHNSGPHFKRPP